MLYYDNVLKGIEAFKGQTIQIADISIDWLKQYEKFLLTDKNHTTVSMHMRAIRAILNDLKKAGMLKEAQYPFGKNKYEIKVTEGNKRALSLEQIKKVISYSDGTEATEHYRDLWFFMYLCNGINVADLLKLKYTNLQDGEISFIRQKTEKTAKTRREIHAVVTPEMDAIIKRWGNKPLSDNNIFPYLTGSETPEERKRKTTDITRRINRRMQMIGERVGIEGITTYTARHSYATVLKRSGANVAYISESLGHTDLKITETYLASFGKEEREKNAALLTQFEE